MIQQVYFRNFIGTSSFAIKIILINTTYASAYQLTTHNTDNGEIPNKMLISSHDSSLPFSSSPQPQIGSKPKSLFLYASACLSDLDFVAFKGDALHGKGESVGSISHASDEFIKDTCEQFVFWDNWVPDRACLCVVHGNEVIYKRARSHCYKLKLSETKMSRKQLCYAVPKM